MQCEWSGRAQEAHLRTTRAKKGGKAALGNRPIDAPRLLAHEARRNAVAALPLSSPVDAPRWPGRVRRSGAGAGRRRAGRPLRRPGGDGADPRRRQGRLLHRPRAEPAHSAYRRPLPATLARHGGLLSRRRGGGGHHVRGCGDRPSALPRGCDQGSRRIDRPRPYPDRPSSWPRASPARRSPMAARRRSAHQ